MKTTNETTNETTMKTKTMQLLLGVAAVAAAGAAGAQASAADHGAHHPAASAVAQASAPQSALPSEGEVRKVDTSAGKLTLKHGPIANLDMPPMTMVFRVTDPALLAAVKQGDKVRFKADKVNGAYVVTAIEAAK